MDNRAEACKIMEDAHRIAALIRATNTDVRHVLYDEIAIELKKWSQGYTSTQFRNLALADKTGANLTCSFVRAAASLQETKNG